jgi:cysteinyl-tRNA synthetase
MGKGELLCSELKSLSWRLGLLDMDPAIFLSGLGDENLESVSLRANQIQQLIDERMVAREQGDWDRADEIRKILSDSGIIIEDLSDGTTKWRLDRIYSRE